MGILGRSIGSVQTICKFLQRFVAYDFLLGCHGFVLVAASHRDVRALQRFKGDGVGGFLVNAIGDELAHMLYGLLEGHIAQLHGTVK